jgi:hypothetical protein
MNLNGSIGFSINASNNPAYNRKNNDKPGIYFSPSINEGIVLYSNAHMLFKTNTLKLFSFIESRYRDGLTGIVTLSTTGYVLLINGIIVSWTVSDSTARIWHDAGYENLLPV